MFKFCLFADFSGQDVRMRVFDSYSGTLAAAAAAYAMGAKDVVAVVFFPKTQDLLDEMSKQLKVEGGHTAAN